MCIRDRGYIYSIKGKGSFVADNSRMKAGILQEWKGLFKSAVEEGIKVGATAGEMKEMIDAACRNHVIERGEDVYKRQVQALRCVAQGVF